VQPVTGPVVPPFHEQVNEAVARVPEVRLVGEKAWIHDVHAAHQANPANPRLTLDEFKRLLVEDENRAKLTLGRADLAHRMDRADVAASETEYKIGERKAATFNFVRPTKAPTEPMRLAPTEPSDAQIQKALDSLYSKAESAKEHIDSVASSIAREADHGSIVVIKTPLKGKTRAFEKVKNEYGGDVSRLTDVARNTILADETAFNKVIVLLDKEGATIKVVGPGADPMGYTGINAKLPTKSGLKGEIQVNSAKMIYAKEPPAIAKSILGEEKWNEIAAKTQLPGGQGHKLYEEYRSTPAGDPKRSLLENESREYYNQIRERG